PWDTLRFLEGTWEAFEEDIFRVTQSYRFVLDQQFLEMRTHAVFWPSEERPEGETHEDFGIFSYDRARKTFVLRAFYSEGFVNTYILEPSDDPNVLTFTTEAVQNAPEGTRARLVFRRISEDEVEQSFFVAWPAEEFTCTQRYRLRRVG
ncbi:MAG: hypothetical protein ACE5LV_10075, partial [Candidatus Aminicenantales bacterium]